MLEKEIERVLVEQVKRLGGRAYKWVSPGNDGVPDRIVILPGERPCFVELKTETGKLSRLQELQIGRLRKLGQDVRVLHGIQEVDAFLEECERKMGYGI
ncbi:VRR-NUC domain-containing protein [Wansuia hejianensis]|uniref:VRR-NUC domain-containing protein n=1 Tax=Wansuia hejianensis TaxID=2763667 RepID=A0A7G9G8Q5_9FIRM|nr:VRR-NUC domain-containing protein [Wansuia hejianensis]QNM07187.1 VRR-NUC domain-containing protein [Wansuia hejianensis]RHV91247.1 VRR-NUC domain-containing protein [Lachnospiraceae bacterium OF09-33XD]